MRTRLLNTWRSLCSSYWFVPSIMTLLAFALASAMIRLDEWIAVEQVNGLGFVYLNQPDGARALFSTVASSIIGVAGVTFSLTMVVLSLPSSQYGSRLLGSYMQDTGNQVVLGTFVATHLYCLLVLRTVHNTGGAGFFVPNLAITVAVVLTVASLGFFICSIHHTADSIRAGTVISSIAADLNRVIEPMYKNKNFFYQNDEAPELPEDFEERVVEVPSDKAGYLQFYQEDALLNIARDNDFIVRLNKHIGELDGVGEPFLEVSAAESLGEDLQTCLQAQFAWRAHRATAREFDVLFNQLVELAPRALSPGVNNPFTAVMCLDRLGEALGLLLERDHPLAYRRDNTDQLRLLTKTQQPGVDLIRSTLGPIQHYGAGTLIVLRRFIETVRLVLHYTGKPDEQSALKEQAPLAVAAAREALAREDYSLLDKLYRVINNESEKLEPDVAVAA